MPKKTSSGVTEAPLWKVAPGLIETVSFVRSALYSNRSARTSSGVATSLRYRISASCTIQGRRPFCGAVTNG